MTIPDVSTIVQHAGEGYSIPGPHGRQINIRARGEETGGTYSLLELSAPPGSPWTPPHVHHDAEEAWYVLEGTLSYRLGDQTVEASAGAYLMVPRGTVHTFGNTGTTMARYLIIFSPPGMEQYFEELAALMTASEGGPPSEEAIRALAARHHLERVPPTS